MSKFLRKFEIGKLDSKALRDKVQTEKPIAIQAYGRNVEYALTPNDLRVRDFHAIERTD